MKIVKEKCSRWIERPIYAMAWQVVEYKKKRNTGRAAKVEKYRFPRIFLPSFSVEHAFFPFCVCASLSQTFCATAFSHFSYSCVSTVKYDVKDCHWMFN